MNRIAIRLMLLLDAAKNEDRGAVAAEYGVLIAGVVAVVAIAVAALGPKISGLLNSAF
jgi:Flp pilus assembly pilin Flp